MRNLKLLDMMVTKGTRAEKVTRMVEKNKLEASKQLGEKNFKIKEVSQQIRM